MSRKRYAGGAEALADALAPVVEGLGRTWCQYDEAVLAAKSKVDVEKIQASHGVLQVLHACQPNRAFSKKVFYEVAGLLLRRFCAHPEWALKEEHEESYKTVLSLRLGNLCRAVSQAQIKHPRCGWVLKLPWNEGHAPADDSAQHALEEDYVYGWDATMMTAWRTKGASRGAGQKRKLPKEMAAHLHIPEEGPDTAPVTAHWPDGSSWTVTDVTKAELLAKPASRAPDTLWEGTHVVSKNALAIRFRKDRSPLLVLLEQRRQVLQISIKACNGDQEQAFKIVKAVTEQYMGGKVMTEDLCEVRNGLMREAGFGAKPTKQVEPAQKKRPAAAAEPEEDSEPEAHESDDDFEAIQPILMPSPPDTSVFARSDRRARGE